MEKFNTMLKAAECAVTRCNSWSFANSDEKYYKKSLIGIAEVSDAENPADEDSFYVVSPGGAIGFCEDGEVIDWLFLTGSNEDEDLPAAYQTGPQINFCPKCGNSDTSGARFCGDCGAKLN